MTTVTPVASGNGSAKEADSVAFDVVVPGGATDTTMVVGAGTDGTTVNWVTVDGVSAVAAGTQTVNGAAAQQIYYLGSVGTGTLGIVVQATGGNFLACGAECFASTDTASPIESFIATSGSGGAPSLIVSATVAGARGFCSYYEGNEGGAGWIVGSGETAAWSNTVESDGSGGEYSSADIGIGAEISC